MKNKLILSGFIILLLTVGVFAFLYYDTNSKLEEAQIQSKLDKKKALEELEKQYEEAIKLLNSEFLKLHEEYSNQEDNVKYIPYEKLLYVDRDVDTALDIIANYNFNSGADKKKK